MAMALSELSGPTGPFQHRPLEKSRSPRELLAVETSVTRARVRAHLGRAFARALPRRQTYSTGQ